MRAGATAGALAILLFVAAALVIGSRPGMDASGADVAANLAAHRTRIQVGCALNAATAPLWVWFLATVASLARAYGPGARRAGEVAFGSGLVFVAVFLVDVSALAVSALRPGDLVGAPELASALRDFEWLAIAMASFAGAGVLGAFGVLALRHKAVWPEWLGWLAAIASVAYSLRIGALFTTNGGFVADGVLGLYVPVIAFAGWTLTASLSLALMPSSRHPGQA
jgi:hypothetical protein